ncbi:hypothetical protein Q5530_15285 [Saccharothrix sp. BKS2]|uniref:hypothetical protein n=1 Tax=Saccharothrix sp. BKS2 TaxID=3064400 RepID=UPI0039E9F398
MSEPGPPPKGPWHLVAAVLAYTGVIAVLLYHLGWSRAAATAWYFGVDPSVVGFVPLDYLLRSPNSAVAAVLVMALLLMAALTTHHRLVRRLHALRGRPRHNALRALVAVRRTALCATAAVVVGWLCYAELADAVKPFLSPALFLCAATAAYTSALLPRFDPVWAEHHAAASTGHRLMSFALIGICFAGAVNTAAWYADLVGRQAAEEVAAGLDRWPNVVVVSAHRLAVEDPSVSCARIDDADEKFRHRCTGLRLIMRNGRGEWLLVPAGWQPGRGRVLVQKDGADIRVEMG